MTGTTDRPSELARRVDCGPEGCTIDWLASERLEVDADPEEFSRLATDAGWGDGLPLVPPTEARVRRHVAASGRFPDELLAELPPRNGRCTVEKLAINAVMAGAPAAAMPLLCAAIEAMADPLFNLFALNTTTCSVVPGLFVHGPDRDALGIPYDVACFGGVAGPAPAIGRATRLVMRNVGGQVAGINSKSVFGQPGRVTGVVVGEWEERSPWPTLGERRGVPPGMNAVTVHGVTGTIDIADIVARDGRELLEVIGKSLAFPGTNAFIGAHHGAEVLLAVAPPWADLIASAYPDVDVMLHALWDHAALPLDWWPVPHRAAAEENGRVGPDGRVHLVETPQHLLVMVCGGLGNLHALACHSFGPTRAVTRTFPRVPEGSAVRPAGAG
jgi:hypothetical protein